MCWNKGGRVNTENNIRTRNTKEKIERALMYLLKRKSFSQIYVKDICTVACINRSSFYEHYQDINDLMMKIESKLSNEMANLFVNPPFYANDCFVKMFEHISNNRDFYKAYLTYSDSSIMEQTDFLKFFNKLENDADLRFDYGDNEIIYHMAFFSAGLKAICKVWLNTGLKETPAQMAEIVYKEYSKKSKFFNK